MVWGIPDNAVTYNPRPPESLDALRQSMNPYTDANAAEYGLSVANAYNYDPTQGRGLMESFMGDDYYQVNASAIKEEDKTVEDYMREYQEEADLNDRIALSGVDPRGYSSRAIRALRDIFSGSTTQVATGGSAVAREQGGQNIMQNIGTLLDPSAWMADKNFTDQDIGGKGGEFGVEKNVMYKPGQVYEDSQGNLWKFTGFEAGKMGDIWEDGNMGHLGGARREESSNTRNAFEFVGTTKMQQEADKFYQQRGKATRNIYK